MQIVTFHNFPKFWKKIIWESKKSKSQIVLFSCIWQLCGPTTLWKRFRSSRTPPSWHPAFHDSGSQFSKIQESWILVVRQVEMNVGPVQRNCSNDCNVCTALTGSWVKETRFTIHFKTSKHGILNKNVNFVFRVPVRRFSEQQRGLHPNPWGFRTPHWECSLFEHCLFFLGFIHWANENRVVGVDAHYFVSCFVPQLKNEHFANSNSDQLLSAQPK